MGPANKTTAGLIARYASRLRFPYLLLVTATLFVLDLIVPDFIPFVDEALLGLITLVLATWKRRKEGPTDGAAPAGDGSTGGGRVIDVTHED